jgi:hypothetical protein
VCLSGEMEAKQASSIQMRNINTFSSSSIFTRTPLCHITSGVSIVRKTIGLDGHAGITTLVKGSFASTIEARKSALPTLQLLKCTQAMLTYPCISIKHNAALTTHLLPLTRIPSSIVGEFIEIWRHLKPTTLLTLP